MTGCAAPLPPEPMDEDRAPKGRWPTRTIQNHVMGGRACEVQDSGRGDGWAALAVTRGPS